MDEERLYPIGDVARRTSLSVSAIRFYADAGIVAPTGHTAAGYRLYDIDAVARLELVHMLRELDTPLDGIRQVLTDGTTLHDLAAAHLAVIERQERLLRARSAVLRTLVKQKGTAERLRLMHRLVPLSDADRDRLMVPAAHQGTTPKARGAAARWPRGLGRGPGGDGHSAVQ